MAKKCRLRAAAAALAAAMALSVPVQAYSGDLITGTADLPGQEEILTGTLGLPEEDDFFGEEDIMLLGLSADAESVEAALNRVLGYLGSHSDNLTVGTEGGEWSLMVLARNGKLSPGAKETYMKNLLAALDKVKGKLSGAKYTEYSRVTLAMGALGVNPVDVGGYDILLPLSNFSKVQIQGINGPIWALIALDSRNYEVRDLPEGEKGEQTSREGIIRHLLDNQYVNQDGVKGGWSFSGRGLDDINPMAIQALAPYYKSNPEVKAAVDQALALWSGMQSQNGGFGDEGSSGNGGVEAICQTIIALAALQTETGENFLESEMFVKDGNNLINALLQYQAEDGSFCHVLGDGGGNAIATDQAALALTAYSRAVKGKTRLYNMTDVPMQGGEAAKPEEVEALQEELDAIPAHPNLDHLSAVNGLQVKLSQIGDFPEKEAMQQKLAELKKVLEAQQDEVKAWDEDIWKINPSKVTEADRSTVEGLRQRYNSMIPANRKYLQRAEDLIAMELRLLDLDNKEFLLLGEKGGSAQPARRPSGGNGGGSHVTTSVESNTVNAKVENGVVKAEQLKEIMGQERNLRMSGRFHNGEAYTMTIHGKDFSEASDVQTGIRLSGEHEKEILRLTVDPVIFHLDQEGYFPGDIMVEMPVEAEDGTYMLLRYNEQERRADFIGKPVVEDGMVTFSVEQGGDYMLTQKAISKSLDELDAATEPTETTEPTVPEKQEPVETHENPRQPEQSEAEDSGVPMYIWICAGTAAAILAAAVIVIIVLLVKRKASK